MLVGVITDPVPYAKNVWKDCTQIKSLVCSSMDNRTQDSTLFSVEAALLLWAQLRLPQAK